MTAFISNVREIIIVVQLHEIIISLDKKKKNDIDDFISNLESVELLPKQENID